MSDDDKKKVNIEDLPVPLKELDKEEQENVTGGIDGVKIAELPDDSTAINPTNPTNPRNPDLSNPTFNR